MAQPGLVQRPLLVEDVGVPGRPQHGDVPGAEAQRPEAFDQNIGVRAGSLLVVAGTLYVIRHLSRHGATRPMPADLGTADCLTFHRAELARQRDLLSGVWRWYLLPFVPGVTLIVIARALERPERPAMALGVAAAMVAFFTFVWWLNQRVARRIQRRIDALDGAR